MSAKQTKKPIKIAFVTDSVYPYNKGGKETRLYEISRRLVRADREIHIYTMKWWDGPNQIQHEGVYLNALCRLYPLYAGNRRSITQALAFGLATFKLVFEQFDVLDVDHMPFYPLFSARIVTWIKRKRLVATWHEVWGHDYWYEYLKGPIGIFGFVTEWLSFRLPDLIISNSEHTTKKLKATGVTKTIFTIPLGVDLDAVNEAIPSTEMTDVIYVGRLLAHKNVDLLIRAIGMVKQTKPNIKCIVIGDGPEQSKLSQLISDLKLNENIRMTGFISENADIYGFMKSSKVLVLPSVREGYGLVAVEANAAGIPAITIDHPDNAARDLIEVSRNGYLCEPTFKSIAIRINQALAENGMDPAANVKVLGWGSVVLNFEKAIE